jgi:alpha-galactosidase
LASWIPFFGQGTYYNPKQTVYNARSHFCPAFAICADVRKDGIDWPTIRRITLDWQAIADDLLLGDYYPLTPYSRDMDRWIAWQFNRPGEGDGVVQAFRRSACAEAIQTLRLRGLDPAAMYEVTNFDVNGSTTMSGQDLMEKGLTVEIKDKPGAAVIVYRRK